MDNNTNFSDVLSSYGRCLLKRGFIERFYELFMASDDSIRALFARTDMSKVLRARAIGETRGFMKLLVARSL